MTNRVHAIGYCKIPLISPGLTFIVYNFIRGFEGAYYRGKNISSCLIKIQYMHFLQCPILNFVRLWLWQLSGSFDCTDHLLMLFLYRFVLQHCPVLLQHEAVCSSTEAHCRYHREGHQRAPRWVHHSKIILTAQRVCTVWGSISCTCILFEVILAVHLLFSFLIILFVY